MSKQQLTELLIKGDKPYSYQNDLWFKRYNDVVDVYNASPSKTAPLEKLHCPYPSFIYTSYLLNNYLLNIAMVLVFTFIPILNIALQFCVVSYTLFLKRETKKHKQNLQIVEDPFINFYYYPEMCRQLEKHFTTLNLTVDQIENFRFNETHDRLRQLLLDNQNQHTKKEDSSENRKNNNNNKVKVPIYDQYFYDSFFLVRKEYFKAISWSMLGVVLMGLSCLFYYAIYQDFIQE